MNQSPIPGFAQNKSAFTDSTTTKLPPLTTIIFSIFSIFLCFCYFIYVTGRRFAQRFFFLPPTDFRDSFKLAIEKPNGKLPTSKIGIKRASMRRRLIMGSKKPQVYSTLPLNSVHSETGKPVDNSDKKYYTLRVSNIDKLPDNKDSFLMNIKPIDVRSEDRRKLFGFFHPFSYALGGGEKVLWEAVVATLECDINNIAIIYTFTPSKDSSVYSILYGVQETFGINLLHDDRKYITDRIVFIHLPDKYSWLINGNSYRVLSMIGQALGSILLVFFGFQQVTPDIFIDTIGLPFTYSLIYGFLNIPIISYIHYPTVSRDMLIAAKNIGGIYGLLKWTYWWVILKLYTLNIIWVNTALFNSTWTAENVASALGSLSEIDDLKENILYPPCVSYDDEKFDKISISNLINNKRERQIVYLAQFRPEKRHSLLIKHYKEYLNQYKGKDPHKLIFIGAVRLNKDEKFIKSLQDLIKELEIPLGLINFELNATTEALENILQSSDFGINCMWKEHFGIAVVEYMLNGAIPLVHASAGPLEDIVVPRVDGHVLTNKEKKEKVKIEETEVSGLFFRDETDPDYKTNAQTYPSLTEMLINASNLSDVSKLKIRENAVYVSREKFGKGVFSRKWGEYTNEIIEIESTLREARGKVEQVY
ncbi:asparagine-linked glycosylation protein [Pichia californica]|uniref:GDP-Man:Man(3)GlcNAc(2)-PP-Dol alpha-1,2-mannosyltransferase n=1 Tax=Pichia californica TaxID=460514 RepID=A0A9P7BHV7_9ASCO|nr:asparagine-linked glycosylation protein [[Candida] californica]KAG0690574.1 asparagine-linked glycosylation protein [[Candida] californica]